LILTVWRLKVLLSAVLLEAFWEVGLVGGLVLELDQVLVRGSVVLCKIYVSLETPARSLMTMFSVLKRR
jgi:hypothetical protein